MARIGAYPSLFFLSYFCCRHDLTTSTNSTTPAATSTPVSAVNSGNLTECIQGGARFCKTHRGEVQSEMRAIMVWACMGREGVCRWTFIFGWGKAMLGNICSQGCALRMGLLANGSIARQTDTIRDGCCYVFVVEGGGGAGSSSVNESRFSLLRFLATFATCAFCPTLGDVLSTSRF